MTSYALCNKYIDDVIYYKLYLINDNTICFRTNPKNKKNNKKIQNMLLKNLLLFFLNLYLLLYKVGAPKSKGPMKSHRTIQLFELILISQYEFTLNNTITPLFIYSLYFLKLTSWGFLPQIPSYSRI
jgi:hypothetical protein